MEPSVKLNVVIIGGGLVGALEACLMAKRGHDVTVYDKRPDLRYTPHITGRSINLSLNIKGLEALKAVDLDRLVLDSLAVPMTGRVVRINKRIFREQFPADQGYLYSINRRMMNQVLLSAAEKYSNVNLKFHHKLLDVELNTGRFTVMDLENNTVFDSHADLIIGCDGSHSVVRRKMIDTPGFNISQEYIEHQYIEMCIPPNEENQYQLSPNLFWTWLVEDTILFGLPTHDQCINLMFMSPMKTYEKIRTGKQLTEYLGRLFPDILPLIGSPKLTADFFSTKPYALHTIKCRPFHRGKCILMGDSAHTPLLFYGLGMNCGFQDALCFNNLLGQFGEENLEHVLDAYSNQRVPEGEAVCDLSVRMYLSLKNASTASWINRLGEAVDRLLNILLPKMWPIELHSVFFTQKPYHECLDEISRQRLIVGYCLKATYVMLVGIAFGFGTYFAPPHCRN